MAATVEESPPPDMATAMVRFGMGFTFSFSQAFRFWLAVTMQHSNKVNPGC